MKIKNLLNSNDKDNNNNNKENNKEEKKKLKESTTLKKKNNNNNTKEENKNKKKKKDNENNNNNINNNNNVNEIINNDENNNNNIINEENLKNLLEKTLKKHILENVIPIIIELKKLLEQKKSPLLKELMNFLKIFISDYKNKFGELNINIIFNDDKYLLKEIEFDIKKNEKILIDNNQILKSPLKNKSPFQSPRKFRNNNNNQQLINNTPPRLKKRLFSENENLHNNDN
jgi:hypothetical protein